MLYIKPANTHAQDGDAILVPADVAEVQVGACLGIVFGRTATRVSAAQALDYVAGYRVVADLSEPHASYFRPALEAAVPRRLLPHRPGPDARRIGRQSRRAGHRGAG